jgi:ABC-2 type transport system ATP-binding protein
LLQSHVWTSTKSIGQTRCSARLASARRQCQRTACETAADLLLESKTEIDPSTDDREIRLPEPWIMRYERTHKSAPTIVADGLTKRYGRITAVRDLSFNVRSGAVTGFFGPNGAGKTTALKMLVGLARPSAGRAFVNGAAVDTAKPDARDVGVYIEPCGAHPGRTARAHLRALAVLAGLPRHRVDEVLAVVELDQAGRRRVGKYSMGMRQRLGLAAALLGDPEILVLDEPVNGLDPRGIAWLRTLLREQAARGRTVLLSSHVLSEAAQTVDDVVVIDHGRVVHQGSIRDLESRGGSLEDAYLEMTGGVES